MRILGIDPGFGRMGFGVVEKKSGDWTHVVHGCIETSAKKSFRERLLEIHSSLEKIIADFNPDLAAVEELFFYNNAKTAMQVGQARGVILLTLFQAKLPVEEFTPLEVKQAITGYGRADKGQVQRMLSVLLKTPKKPIQDDAADALAIALCAGASLKMKRVLTKG